MKSILARIVASIILTGVVSYIQRAAASPCDTGSNCATETTMTIPQGDTCGSPNC